MTIADEMLRYRAKENISQDKAAKSAGITRQTWHNIETKVQTPSRVTAEKIRMILDERNDADESVSITN